MEAYTLVVWLMIGQRYDELRIDDLSWRECAAHVVQIFADRGTSMGKCISSKSHVRPIMPDTTPEPRCAHGRPGACRGPLPGRRYI